VPGGLAQSLLSAEIVLVTNDYSGGVAGMTKLFNGGMTRRGMMGRGLMAGAIAAAGAGRLMTLEQAFAQGIAPKSGGTLTTFLTPEPPILINAINFQSPTIIVGSKIYQGLLKYGFDLTPMPQLAKSWEVSPDVLTYTFHLQENVKWHDGQDFTADDVIFSLTKFHIEMSPRARSILRKVKDAKALDAHTVQLTLDSPFEPFLLAFDVATLPMMPKHIYDGTDYRTNPMNLKPIGTGAFALAEWQHGNFIRLHKFADYWKPGQPYLDEIIYRIAPDSQSRELALQTGQVMFTQANDIEPFDVPRLREQPNLVVETRGWEMFSPLMWIEVNHRIKPLDDKRVRQALSHAFDRKFIVDRLWFGVGRPATGPIASTTRFYDPSSKLQDYNPRTAQELLDAAGLKPNAQGIRLSVKHLPLPYSEIWARLAEYMRAAAKQSGIELVIESTDAAGWAQRVGAWDYETSINYVYQYGDPTLGVERTYISSNIQKILASNTGGYSNPQVDALFATARSSGDPAVRKQAFYELQKILIEDVPVVWLMEMVWPTIYDKKVHNLVELGTGIHASFDDVFLA
jgi:peptide/nickel transport system substrate-binding protein